MRPATRGGPRMRGPATLGALAAAGVVAVSVGRPAPADALRVFAAASLADAFRDLAAAFEGANPGARVELNFAGSQVLRTQIEQGAGAHVFASADVAHAADLQRAGRLEGYRVFATTRLVVAVPAVGTPAVSGLADLAHPGVKVVVASAAVPAGRYTERLLARLGGVDALGPDFAARVRANVVSREPNVRAVAAKVALGEADAGFVYETDAAATDRLRRVAVPAGLEVVAEYAIGLVAPDASATARAFVEFVLGPEGGAILRRRGFQR